MYYITHNYHILHMWTGLRTIWYILTQHSCPAHSGRTWQGSFISCPCFTTRTSKVICLTSRLTVKLKSLNTIMYLNLEIKNKEHVLHKILHDIIPQLLLCVRKHLSPPPVRVSVLAQWSDRAPGCLKVRCYQSCKQMLQILPFLSWFQSWFGWPWNSTPASQGCEKCG